MNRLRIVIIAFILFTSCSQTVKESDNIRYSNEEELINRLFWDFILPVPPCFQSDTSMEDTEIYWSEYYTKLESYRHKVYFRDSLSKPKTSEFEISDLPDDFRHLCTSLFNDTTLKQREFIPNPERIGFKIDLITDFSIDSIRPENFIADNVLGLFSISRVSFNEDYSRACLLLSAISNDECTQLILFCVEKQTDIWTINDKRVLLN